MTARSWVPVLIVWVGPLTSTSNVSRRRSTRVSRHETLTDSPTAAGPVWLTHTWVPTVGLAVVEVGLYRQKARLLDELDHRRCRQHGPRQVRRRHVGGHLITRSVFDPGRQGVADAASLADRGGDTLRWHS